MVMKIDPMLDRLGKKCNTMQLSYSYSFGLTREQKIIDVKYVGRKNWTQQKRFRPP
jgi:hypothetical protein